MFLMICAFYWPWHGRSYCRRGNGRKIWYQSLHQPDGHTLYDNVFAAIVIIGVIGLAIDQILAALYPAPPLAGSGSPRGAMAVVG